MDDEEFFKLAVSITIRTTCDGLTVIVQASIDAFNDRTTTLG